MSHTTDIASLRAEVDHIVKELHTQLTRIAQIQAQLDHMAKGEAGKPHKRRSTDQTEH